MKYQLFILLVVILPFASLSCNNTNKSTKEVVKKTNLQQLIKSNQSNSSINWITLAELEEKAALNPKKAIFAKSISSIPLSQRRYGRCGPDSEYLNRSSQTEALNLQVT